VRHLGVWVWCGVLVVVRVGFVLCGVYFRFCGCVLVWGVQVVVVIRWLQVVRC